MPRVKIETSLYDPLVIELGDKVYTSVPRSMRLIRELETLKKKGESGEIDDLEVSAGVLGFVFGVESVEFETIDGALLVAIAEKATQYIGSWKPKGPIPAPAPDFKLPTAEEVVAAQKEGRKIDPFAEAESEKNVPKPGSEPSP